MHYRLCPLRHDLVESNRSSHVSGLSVRRNLRELTWAHSGPVRNLDSHEAPPLDEPNLTTEAEDYPRGLIGKLESSGLMSKVMSL